MTVKNCEKLEKSQVALTVEVSAEEFEAAVEKAYQKMRKKINVPGFRPGKAPRKVIEGMYGAEVFFEEAMNNAFPEAYEAAVKEQDLQVVGYPSVELVGECTKEGFTFKAIAPVYPEVTLGEYKGLSAPKDEVKVTAADVDERLKELTDRAGVSAPSSVTADFLLEERARELMWEGHRRTDLIRYGKFTTPSFLWTYKGGTFTGQGFDDYMKIFAIPSSELASNPELHQNPGYGNATDK